MATMTKAQQEFFEKMQTKFQDDQWSVSSYYKYADELGDWVPFKFQLLNFALTNKLCFVEKVNFVHIGRSIAACDYADAQLRGFLTERPLPNRMVANNVQSNLN
jgi:hypothetical protein